MGHRKNDQLVRYTKKLRRYPNGLAGESDPLPVIYVLFLLWSYSGLNCCIKLCKWQEFSAWIGPPRLKAEHFLLPGVNMVWPTCDFGNYLWFRHVVVLWKGLQHVYSFCFSERFSNFTDIFCSLQLLHCTEAKGDCNWELRFKKLNFNKKN
jgi:hypothetical protein